MKYVFFCIFFAFFCQILDYLYHRKNLNSITFSSSHVTFNEIRTKLKGLGCKRLDNYFGLLPFIWTYLFIIAAIILFNKTDAWFIKISLILFVTGRYRALQEIAHFAVHGTLCPNLKWGLRLANLFYQFPLWMPQAKIRRNIHVKQHHHSVNMQHDPDLKELLDKKFKPGINELQFWLKVFYPLTFAGIKDRIYECFNYLWDEWRQLTAYLRLLNVGTIVTLFIITHSISALIGLYLIPVLFIYPTFYWLAHIALHRWFAPCNEKLAYYQRELELGRPTEFKGISGFLIRHTIFPLGDSYHLAHSLFPTIRWNYLPQVDQLLKKYCREYTKYISCNLIFGTKNRPSAISELKQRLVINSVPQKMVRYAKNTYK